MKKKPPNNFFFKTVVHQCNDLVVITDHQAIIVYVNPAFEKHTGYLLKNIKGENISIVKSGAHNTTFYKNLWKKLKEGKPKSTVFINKKKNGELYYENKTITPIKDKGGEIEYYLSTSKDVTIELRLQKEILKQKNFINSVVQHTDALIIGIDTDFRITLFNTACEKLTGYKYKEVNGKHFADILVPKEERRTALSSFKQITNKNKRFLKNEYYWITKSGIRILVSWSHTLIKDEKGNPQVILSTGIDITKERENENKLLQLNLSLDQKVKEKTKKLYTLNGEIIRQNKFICKINRELPALVYLIDLKGKTIRLFNNQINKKISIPEKKDTDLPINNFLKYIDTRLDENSKDVFLSGPVENAEIPFIISNKNYWFQNRSIVFEKNKNNSPAKILGFISDITKTKFIQNKLEESQKIAQLGTWEWNIENNDLYWSDEIYRIFEINPKKFKPSYPKFLDAAHPEDKDLIVKAVNECLKNKTIYEVVHRLKAKSGRIKFVREKGYALFSEDGKPLRMIGTVQDITEEKLLKDNLKSAYVTLQNSLNAIFMSDLNGNVLYANNSAAKMWGYTDLNEMLGKRAMVYDYWPEKYKSEINKIIGVGLKNGFYYSERPFTSIKKNKSEVLVKFNLSVIKNENEDPYALTWAFFDVTEQVRIEKAVREYDTKINRLLGNIDEVVFGIDASFGSYTAGKVFYLSAKSKELMGFDLNYLKALPGLWNSLIHPEDLQGVCQTNLECMTKKTTVTRTYRLMHYETKIYKWFEEKITPYYDENGELKSYYGSSRDVTDRIEKDRKLKDSEEKYRLLSDNNRDLISLSDENGNSSFISNSVKNLLGYTVEEYLQTNLFDVIHPDDRERIKTTAFNPNFEDKEKGFTEGRIRHKDGHYIWVQTLTSPVIDEKGKVIRIVGSSRDITGRKQLEDVIIESEKKYRSIFENALVGIFRTNIKTQKPIDANDICIKLFGYKSKEDFLENFVSTERYFDLSEREEWLKNLKANPSMMNQKIRFKRKDGSLFWGNTSAKILPGYDIMEGVVIDITEKHEYEEQLKKNLKEKEVLLKEVHHRVKNNLQIISSLLKLQLNKIDSPEQRQPLIESYERIHAIALIHEKLYLSDDVSTINFSEYLTNLTKMMLSLHVEKGIKVNFNVDYFATDISKAIPLGLICYEIISNAFKHAFHYKKNNQLSVEVKVTGESTQIVIEDTGDGFNVELLASTNTLGWKLINNLAKQAKASIEVISAEEKGTRFNVRLISGEN